MIRTPVDVRTRIDLMPLGKEGAHVGLLASDLLPPFTAHDVKRVLDLRYENGEGVMLMDCLSGSLGCAYDAEPDVFMQITSGDCLYGDFSDYLDHVAYLFRIPANIELLGHYLMMVRSVAGGGKKFGLDNSMSRARALNDLGLEMLHGADPDSSQLKPVVAIGFAETRGHKGAVLRQSFFVPLQLRGEVEDETVQSMIARAIQL